MQIVKGERELWEIYKIKKYIMFLALYNSEYLFSDGVIYFDQECLLIVFEAALILPLQ